MGESPERRIDRLQKVLQQAILRDYPNPERKECPGEDTLRKLATRQYGDDHPAWDHVTHCSPCYQEFLTFVEDVRREERIRGCARRRNVLVAAVAVGILTATAVVTWRIYSPNGAPQSALAQYEPATLDLKSESIRRGDQQKPRQAQPRILQRKRLDLSIYLPVGSERGQYQIQVVQKAGEPIIETEGTASIENGTTILRTKLDLHDRAAGEYFLGIRQPPWEWTYVPVRVE